ncbi:MAG TPA: DHA2 family efflux MFS transporter permease subunit [Candidatus Dormibacteraeota bacterium]|nr:DHA2 family efflux MFS transporter permease subunit [Candidatus Dormibacteraeota bacterium]
MSEPKTRHTHPWVVLIVLSLGLFMTLLDLTIVNIAIPSLVDGVHATLDQVLWMLNGYSLAYAVLLITSGRTGDILGPRTMFVSGVIVFTAASAFSGLAQTADQLIAGRALQGVGAAMLAPQTLPILLALFPVEKRAPVFAWFGILAGLAVAAGPTLGGWLTSAFEWRWIFFVNLPVGVIVVALALRLVPDLRPGRKHRLDLLGVALVTAALFCVVFGLIEGQRYEWGTVAGFISIPLILGVGVALLAIFGIYQARRQDREPLLNFAVFKDRNFTMMSLVLGAMGFAIVGLYLPLTIYYQSVLGLSAVAAGLIVAIQPGAMFFTSGAANGPAGQKIEPKWLIATGLTLLAAGSAFIAWSAQASSSRWTFVPGLVLSGLGMGMIWGPVYALATRDLRPELGGVAAGIVNTVQELGAVIASAAVGALLQNRLALALHDRAVAASAHLPAGARAQFVSGFSGAARGGFEVGAGQTGANLSGVPPSVAQQVADLAHGVFANAFVDAMKPTLILPVAVIVAAAVMTLFARRRSQLVPAPAAVAAGADTTEMQAVA